MSEAHQLSARLNQVLATIDVLVAQVAQASGDDVEMLASMIKEHLAIARSLGDVLVKVATQPVEEDDGEWDNDE